MVDDTFFIPESFFDHSFFPPVLALWIFGPLEGVFSFFSLDGDLTLPTRGAFI